MSTENEEVVQEQAVAEPVAAPSEVVEAAPEEAPQQSEDEAIQAGFNAVNGIEEPKAPEPEPAPAPQLIAGYTEDEVKAAFAKIAALEQRESKVFGSLGGLKQAIESMRNQPAPAAPKLTLESLKRTSAEYPELAKLIAEDLGSLSMSGDGPAVEQIVEQRVQTSLAKVSQAYEQRFLTVMHPDWKSVVQSNDFVGWKETLPPEDREELDASWDAELIGTRLSEFKAWKAKSTQTKQTNQKRLEAAIAPKSSGSIRPEPTETDAFLAGFKAVRG